MLPEYLFATAQTLIGALQQTLTQLDANIVVAAERYGKSLPAKVYDDYLNHYLDLRDLIEWQEGDVSTNHDVQAFCDDWVSLYHDWILEERRNLLPLERTICENDLSLQALFGERNVTFNQVHEDVIEDMKRDMMDIIPRKRYNHVVTRIVRERLDKKTASVYSCGNIVFINEDLLVHSGPSVWKGALAREVAKAQYGLVHGFAGVEPFNQGFFGQANTKINELLALSLRTEVQGAGNVGAVMLLCELEGSITALIDFLMSPYSRPEAVPGNVETMIDSLLQLSRRTRGCLPAGEQEEETITLARLSMFGQGSSSR